MTATGKNPMKTATAPKRHAQSVPTGAGRSGLFYYPGYLDRAEQAALLVALDEVFTAAPLFTPRMPKSGLPRPAGLGRRSRTRCWRYGTTLRITLIRPRPV